MNNELISINNTKFTSSDFQNALKTALAASVKSNPYSAQITHETPSAFVFLIDQSGSMKGNITFRGEQKPKSEVVAQLVNETINDILNRCQKEDAMRDYFEIAVIGYGGKHREQANFAWEGALEGRAFVKMSELDTIFIEKQDILQEFSVRGGITVTRPKTIKKWISPLAQNLTPMRHALQLTAELLEDWLVRYQNKDIFPPIVINITDGAATDGKEHDLCLAAGRLKNLHTIDGNILVLLKFLWSKKIHLNLLLKNK